MLKIRLAENKDISAVGELCRKSILGTKIFCHINAYGFSRDFYTLWCCVDENDEICALVSKLENDITLVVENYEASEDVCAFLSMVGFSSLTCTHRTAQGLGLNISSTKKAYVYNGMYTGEIIPDLTEEYYKDSYTLICKNIPDSFVDTEEAYLSFLSDFTYRKTRTMARIKGIFDNKKLVSCALTSAETDFSAIISGVACDNGSRSKGIGKITVLSLAGELKKENKSVYVVALNESAEGFYEHIGFEFKEKISFIERM